MTKCIWTDDLIKQEALKYNTKSEFARFSNGAYSAARYRNMLNDICTHMKLEKYSLEYITNEALKYKTKKEFKKNSNKVYQVALRKGILNNICSHMTPRFHWTYNELKKVASKYYSRSEFQHKNEAAYRAAIRINIIDDICEHMYELSGGFDKKMPAILYYIKFESNQNLPVYKIGITNRSTSERIKGMYVNKEYTPTVLEEFYFENGKECYELEQLYHKEFKEYRYCGSDIIKNGNTELYNFDILGVDLD